MSPEKVPKRKEAVARGPTHLFSDAAAENLFKPRARADLAS